MDPQVSKLRKTLNIMFPSAYIIHHHKPPNAACSPLALKPASLADLQQGSQDEEKPSFFEVSDEPSSRTCAIRLRQYLDTSLVDHRAKPFGLCPIRRFLYDQCLDELIRQVTVGCIDQGLLLFRIRNEFKMSLRHYERAYESGVTFGLNKAISSEHKLKLLEASMEQVNLSSRQIEEKCQSESQMRDLEVKNKLDKLDRTVEYYQKQLAIRDKVIEHQRATIRAISSDIIDRMSKDELGKEVDVEDDLNKT